MDQGVNLSKNAELYIVHIGGAYYMGKTSIGNYRFGSMHESRVFKTIKSAEKFIDNEQLKEPVKFAGASIRQIVSGK